MSCREDSNPPYNDPDEWSGKVPPIGDLLYTGDANMLDAISVGDSFKWRTTCDDGARISTKVGWLG